jgi:hypothetical protein
MKRFHSAQKLLFKNNKFLLKHFFASRLKTSKPQTSTQMLLLHQYITNFNFINVQTNTPEENFLKKGNSSNLTFAIGKVPCTIEE